MKSIKITIIAAILTCSAAAAQDEISRHEVSASIGCGASSFQTRPATGKNLWNLANTVGLGYHYLINSNWSIGTGANYAVFRGGISINKHNWKQASINTTMGANTPFDFLGNTTKFKEVQRAAMITIPLMARYQYQNGEEAVFSAALGGKTGIPVSAKKTKTKGKFTTQGYYPNLDVTYEDLSEYGFVTDQSFSNDKTGISLKTAFWLSAELGVKWRVSEMISLYVGFYADCGLNNTMKKKPEANTNIVVYQPDKPDQFTFNSAADSYAKKITPTVVGINMRLSMAVGKNAARNGSTDM